MEVRVKLTTSIDQIIHRHPNLSDIKNLKIANHPDRVWMHKGKKSHDIQVMVIGKTGYGKSSTLNSILGEDILLSSDYQSCTKNVQSLEFFIRDGNYFSIADFPGVGESIEVDSEYYKLYKMMLVKSDVVLYILRADSRDLSIDEFIINNITKNYSPEIMKKFIFAVNFCDKIEPISRGNNIEPSKEQIENIKIKCDFIKNKFKSENKIIPYSANTEWNIDLLCKSMLDVIKKSNFISY